MSSLFPCFNESKQSTSPIPSKRRTRRAQPPASTPPAQPIPAPLTLLSLPDDLLLLIFRHVLSTPHLTPTLSGRALDACSSAFALSSCCTRLRTLFRLSVTHLQVDWHTSVYPHTLAALFASTLRVLRVNAHPRADVLLRELAAQPAPLNLSALSLSHCPAPAKPIQALLNAAPPLKEFQLSFVDCQHLNALLTTIAPQLSGLTKLKLHGVSQLTHTALIALCSSAAQNLTHLALRYIRHSSVNDASLLKILSHCPNITALFLDDLRHVTPTAIAQFVAAYASQLSELRLFTSRITPTTLKSLVDRASSLRALAIEEPTWTPAHATSAVDAFAAAGEALIELHVCDVADLLNADVRHLVTCLPNIQRLTLRRHEFLTDIAVMNIARLGRTLKVLDFRGCFITDVGLHALGAGCTHLEEIALGGDVHDLSEDGAALLGDNAVSNDGMQALLTGCGKSLTHFTWETPRCVLRSATGRDYRVPVGVANLSAKILAKTLAKECPNLLRVEVNGLRPPARERVERARCDLAFIELEEAVKHVVVFLDCEQPF